MEKDKSNSKEKLTKEEKAERRRNDHIAREKDRERKRAKRLNPDYRMLEQVRDRERKKTLRNDETFRSLEKIRDRIRKDRKRIYTEFENTDNSDELIIIGDPILEPEVILSTPDFPQIYPQQPSETHPTNIPQQYNSSLLDENSKKNSF